MIRLSSPTHWRRGGKVEKGYYVDKRSKESRKVRWERLDEDLTYSAKDLDRSVVVKSQIRTVIGRTGSA
jgi:type I restriction enzyme R subunit